MANKKTKKVSFEGFSGINLLKEHKGSECLSNIENFRITKDGSLEKRCGYRPLVTLPDVPRAMWSGFANGSFILLALCGDGVYSIDIENGSYSSVGYAYNIEGEAQFVYFCGNLYLVDKGYIFLLEDYSSTTVSGYVPLLGKNWGSTYPGEIYQPLNILNRSARITYTVSDPPSAYLATNGAPASIEAVYLNGRLLDASEYRYDSDFDVIVIDGLNAGDRAEVALTYEDDAVNDRLYQLLSCTSAIVFGGISNSRMFLWNGDKTNLIFPSAHVSSDDLRQSQKTYPDSSEVYFPEGHEFTVGDGRYAIKAVIRHYDRLLIITEGDAWMADSSACGIEDFPAMNINSTAGSATNGGAVMVGNDPISIGRHCILRWTSDTDELNECNAYSISDKISDMLDEDFFKNAGVFYDRYKEEVWFNSRDESGTVWIYNSERNAWYKFLNIHADELFDVNGSVGFRSGNELYVFDESEYRDYLADGTSSAIVANATSGLLDFGSSSLKKLMKVSCRGDIEGGVVLLYFNADTGRESMGYFAYHKTHKVMEKRIHSGRFGHTALRINAPGAARQSIHSLKIEAKEC